MKKDKIKLQEFEVIKLKELNRQFMLKVVGGDEEQIKQQPSHSNTPNYSFSAELNIDIEANKER